MFVGWLSFMKSAKFWLVDHGHCIAKYVRWLLLALALVLALVLAWPCTKLAVLGLGFRYQGLGLGLVSCGLVNITAHDIQSYDQMLWVGKLPQCGQNLNPSPSSLTMSYFALANSETVSYVNMSVAGCLYYNKLQTQFMQFNLFIPKL